jgi:hypothetical protein
MVKKTKNQKKAKESNQIKKDINLSSINKKARVRLFSRQDNGIAKINTTVIFKLNSEALCQKDFEKDYYKRYIFYMKEEFNSKIITMFFNYISSTKIIPDSFKKNRYFLKEFLKIIIDLLMNEIDLVTMTLIFDKIGWIAEGSDPWIYLYYICLYTKEKVSSENSYLNLEKILEKNNYGFINSFNKWKNNINIKEKLEQIEIIKTNERFRELKKAFNLNDNESKIINYNEIVNKILSSSKLKNGKLQPIKIVDNNIDMNINKIKSLPNNNINITSYQNPYINNNRFESQIKPGQRQNLDIQNNNSFYNDKFFDLSRTGSRNSFMGFTSFDGELYKMPILEFVKENIIKYKDKFFLLGYKKLDVEKEIELTIKIKK